MELTGAGIRPMRMIGDSDLKLVIGRFLLDSAYSSAGESLPASSIGLNEILFITFTGALSGVGGTNVKVHALPVTYDYTTSTVHAIAASAVVVGAHAVFQGVTNAVDLSSFTVRFLAVGR